jgi:hypothetical protein
MRIVAVNVHCDGRHRSGREIHQLGLNVEVSIAGGDLSHAVFHRRGRWRDDEVCIFAWKHGLRFNYDPYFHIALVRKLLILLLHGSSWSSGEDRH